MKKKFTHPPILRAVGIFLMMLLWSFQLKAQNTPVLSWDQSVGCIEYDDEIKDREKEQVVNLLENMEDARCIRFCEGSYVTYSLQASNVASVQWIPTGGSLSSSSNSSATILWGSYGSGNLTINITYNNNKVETYNVCVEKIIRPRAEFQIDGPDPHQREFCIDTAISFDNLSTHNNGSAIVNYLWDFGDPNSPNPTSSLFEPTHTYSQPGPYKVTLRVTNSCNCTDEYTMEIYVKETKPVEITCTSVACEKSMQTYTANDGDCKGDWKVIGGTIVNNYGNAIDVVWDNVDPSDGFGYVSYLSHCSCPFWTTVKIPVILQKAKIKGPDVICQNKQGRFTLPQWPTTDFQWSLSPSGTGTTLALTDQRNEIVVDALDPGTYTLYVEYRNTLLPAKECTGRSEIQFTVVENVSIITDDVLTMCPYGSKTFSSSNGNFVTWEISLNNTVVHTETNSSINYTFALPGVYVITANNNGCISDPVVVEVLKNPTITGIISGPQRVCLNVPYTYSINEIDPDAVYLWSATGGTVVGSNAGTEADIIFTSPNATVVLTKQYMKNGVICSISKRYRVQQLTVKPDIINDSGLAKFCPSSSATFTAFTNGVDVDLIEWKIESSTGATNFGNIVNGINSPNVTVSFNEITSSSTGYLYLTVTKCGIKTTVKYTIQLEELPTLTLDPVGNVCPGDPTISLMLNSSSAGSNSVMISFNGGTPVGPYTFTNNNMLTIPNGFSNNTGSNVSQTITVSLINVCNYSGIIASQNVTVFPLTKIDITPGYHYIVCPATYGQIDLYSSVSTGITASTQFQWYRNNGQIPNATSSNYTITGATPGGTYFVRVKDDNGCWVNSDPILVIEKCGSSSGCTITPDPNVQVYPQWEDCKKITANVTYVGSPTITWQGSPKITLTGGQGTDDATFETTVAGNHSVTVILDYNGCLISKTVPVAKNYSPELKTAVTCNANNTYNVTLYNNSTIYGILPGNINFEYYDASNTFLGSGQNITLNNVAPGTYTYTLKLSSPGKPDCSTSVTLTLDPTPNAIFNLNQLVYCAEEPITLTVPGTYNPAYQYQWHFAGTYFVAGGPVTQINIPNAGSYPISLTIVTPYGCSYTTPAGYEKVVQIKKANFTGTILPDPADFCEGSVSPLYFSGSPTVANAIWMRDNVQVGVGLNYTPTQSGSYWPVLIDEYGCKFTGFSATPRVVTVRKRAYASVNGNASVCYGESINLTGIITDPTVEHRWSGLILPAGYNNWVTGSTNLNLNIAGMAPGTYTYTFEVRPTNDPSCGNSQSVTVVVHPQVTAPNITYTVTKCQPYTLELTANGPSNGTYNWSNGATGQVIEVTHGGVYSVTYTAPTGCSATSSAMTPHNPERSLWVVPSGCYKLCLNQGSYLLGPLGIYESYEWLINGGITQSGTNTSIPNQPITMGGTYQLNIGLQGCTFSSNQPYITPDIEKCPVNPCKIEGGVREIYPIKEGGGYVFSLYFVNPYSYPITINLSSFNNYGSFSPGTFTLAPGFNSFSPVYFYTNATFNPGTGDYIVVQMPGCMDLWGIEYPYYGKSAKGTGEITEETAPTLVLSPNPAFDISNATFTIGSKYQNAQRIVVYDITGIQRISQEVKGAKGEVSLNVGRLAPGTYVVSLEADGKRIVQQKLIKK